MLIKIVICGLFVKKIFYDQSKILYYIRYLFLIDILIYFFLFKPSKKCQCTKFLYQLKQKINVPNL